jgi:chorismate dehydratase
MDAEDLFKPKKHTTSVKAEEKKSIGISRSLALSPLSYGLDQKLLPLEFDLKFGTVQENSVRLRAGEIEMGLISSVEYAIKKETWYVVPDICLSSQDCIMDVQLFFKSGLKGIESIAVDKNAATEFTLLQILMREKYSLLLKYHKMEPDLNKMLATADAALIVGEKALEYYKYHRNRIDLNEEWRDLTGLPFVYSFWAGREDTIGANELKIIRSSSQLGQNNLEKIAKEYADKHQEDWSFYHDFLSNNLSYAFAETEKEGLMEFYNFAFFYGYTEFIPDLHFYNI